MRPAARLGEGSGAGKAEAGGRTHKKALEGAEDMVLLAKGGRGLVELACVLLGPLAHQPLQVPHLQPALRRQSLQAPLLSLQLLLLPRASRSRHVAWGGNGTYAGGEDAVALGKEALQLLVAAALPAQTLLQAGPRRRLALQPLLQRRQQPRLCHARAAAGRTARWTPGADLPPLGRAEALCGREQRKCPLVRA